MSATTETEPRTATRTTDDPPVVPVDRRVPRRTRRLLALGGAGLAAALLTVVAIWVGGSSDGPGDRDPSGPIAVDPVVALTDAAAATGDIESVRVRGTYDRAADGSSTLRADVDGRDVHLRIEGEDGSVEETTVIGDQMWDEGESDGPMTVAPEDVNIPYPQASEAVIEAALQGAEVEDLGTEEVDGVEATRYGIVLGEPGVAALAALAPNVVAQFELEYPHGVTDLRVWVADDLIRRIDVEITNDTGGGGRAPDVDRISLEFFDLGADITIEPPT